MFSLKMTTQNIKKAFGHISGFKQQRIKVNIVFIIPGQINFKNAYCFILASIFAEKSKTVVNMTFELTS